MSEAETDYKPDLMALACEITAAYSTRNHLSPAALPAMIESVHASLMELASGQPVVAPEPVQRMNENQIRKSITPDVLISFIDGMPYKTLKCQKALERDPGSACNWDPFASWVRCG